MQDRTGEAKNDWYRKIKDKPETLNFKDLYELASIERIGISQSYQNITPAEFEDGVEVRPQKIETEIDTWHRANTENFAKVCEVIAERLIHCRGEDLDKMLKYLDEQGRLYVVGEEILNKVGNIFDEKYQQNQRDLIELANVYREDPDKSKERVKPLEKALEAKGNNFIDYLNALRSFKDALIKQEQDGKPSIAQQLAGSGAMKKKNVNIEETANDIAEGLIHCDDEKMRNVVSKLEGSLYTVYYKKVEGILADKYAQVQKDVEALEDIPEYSEFVTPLRRALGDSQKLNSLEDYLNVLRACKEEVIKHDGGKPSIVETLAESEDPIILKLLKSLVSTLLSIVSAAFTDKSELTDKQIDRTVGVKEELSHYKSLLSLAAKETPTLEKKESTPAPPEDKEPGGPGGP